MEQGLVHSGLSKLILAIFLVMIIQSFIQQTLIGLLLCAELGFVGPGDVAVNKPELWSSILWGRKTHKAIISRLGVVAGQGGVKPGTQ